MLSGIFLFGLALRTQYSDFDCGDRTAEECLLEQGVAMEWSRLQLYLGTLLTLLGFGLLLWMRSAFQRQGPPAVEPDAEG